METKLPGVLFVLSAASLLSFWGIYLFAGIPDGMTLSFVSDLLLHSFDPDQEHFFSFVFSALSTLMALICAVIYFRKGGRRTAMMMTIVHAPLAFLIWDWSYALMIALPLTCAGQVFQNASTSPAS